jgi:hypothetical protein
MGLDGGEERRIMGKMFGAARTATKRATNEKKIALVTSRELG